MRRPEIRAVIFDCDGTLVDSEVLSLAVLIEFVAEFGLEISHDEAMRRFAGNELSVVFADIEQRLGHALPTDFLQQFRERQIALLTEELEAIDGAHELLASLEIPFCVASNAPLHKIEVCLRTTQLHHHFPESRIFSAYQIQKWKPHPDLFLQAAAAMNVPPAQCAVVEDSHFGIKAGLAAGMQVFAYCPQEQHDMAGHPVSAVSHLMELAAIFNG